MKTEHPVYEIRVRGHLDSRRLRWFENLTITQQPNGDTVLVAPIQDQSALNGLLSWLYDIGIPLIAVKRIGCKEKE